MSPFVLALSACLLLALLPSGEAVQCWTCASDLDYRCGDPFNTTVPRGSHGYSLTNCDANGGSVSNYQPYVGATRSVCKKSKQLVNGNTVIIRSCAWQTGDREVGDCGPNSGPSNIRVLFCETCDRDACNSASALTSVGAVALAAVSIIALRLR